MSDPAKGDPANVEATVAAGDSGGDLGAWRQRWESGEPFAIDGDAGGIKGRLSLLLRRLARPLVKAMWKRQTAFNLSIVDHLEAADRGRQELLRDLREVRNDLLRDVQNNHRRIAHLEAFKRDGFGDAQGKEAASRRAGAKDRRHCRSRDARPPGKEEGVGRFIGERSAAGGCAHSGS